MVTFFVKTTLILAIAAIATALMRRSSAASRHLVWSCALLAVLCLPLATALLPTLPLPLLRPTIVETVLADNTPLPELQVFEAQPAPAFPDPSPSARGVNRVAATPAAKSGRSLPWIPLIWLVGALLVLSRLVVGFWRRSALARRCAILSESPLLDTVRAHARVLGITRHVRVLIAPTEMMPATWGLLRPTVLLPPSAHQWTEDRLRLVLVHELAHVQRFDTLTAAIAYLATALAWWNPLVWFAAKRAQLERERACDDAVLRSGLSPSRYAEELLEIARTLPAPFAQRLALAMAQPRGIERRIDAILDADQRRAETSRTVIAAAVVLLAAQWPIAAATLVPQEPATVIRPGGHPPNVASDGVAGFIADKKVTSPEIDGVVGSAVPGQAASQALQARTALPTPPRALGIGLSVRSADSAAMSPNFCCADWVDLLRSRINWNSTLGANGTVTISFELDRRGRATIRDVKKSGIAALDLDAIRAISSAQMPPLPYAYTADVLAITLTFPYGNAVTSRPSAVAGPSGNRPASGAADISGAWEPVPSDAERLATYYDVGLAPIRGRFAASQSSTMIDVVVDLPAASVEARKRINGTDPTHLTYALPVWNEVFRLEGDQLVAQFAGKTPIHFRRADPRTSESTATMGALKPLGYISGSAATGQSPQSGPQPIPEGNFGAGAYHPGHGVSNPIRIREVKPEYTDEARKAGLKGIVELEAVIGADGAVTDVRVVRSLDKKWGLDDNARAAVRQTPFVPCKISDKPVACVVVFELAFTLDEPIPSGPISIVSAQAPSNPVTVMPAPPGGRFASAVPGEWRQVPTQSGSSAAPAIASECTLQVVVADTRIDPAFGKPVTIPTDPMLKAAPKCSPPVKK